MIRVASITAPSGRPKTLNLKRVEAELPPLDSLQHAMERMDLIGKWTSDLLIKSQVKSGMKP